MNTIPKLLLLAVLLTLAAGCSGLRGLVTARVRISAGTNQVEIVQPKDTTVDRLTFDPVRGVLTMEGYASAANAEAIAAARAQAEAQERTFTKAFDLVGRFTDTAARLYGIPPAPALPAPPVTAGPTNPWAAPELPTGMKWVLGTNGVPRLAPKDDPSNPHPVP